MIPFLRHTTLFVAALLLSVVLSSCAKDDPATQPQPSQLMRITVLFDINALGDRGFNDNIFEGLYRVKEAYSGSHTVVIQYVVPQSSEEIERTILQWMESDKSLRHLLVITNVSTAKLFDTHPDWQPHANADILFLDDYRPATTAYSRSVSLYGLCHLAGQVVMAFGLDKSAIVMANPFDKPLLDAAQGFKEGFQLAGGSLGSDDIYYLSDQHGAGFDLGDSLFSLADQLGKAGYRFVFPLCGGSSQGLYRYMRSKNYGTTFEPFFTCGIDADQQDYAIGLAFSIIKRYDLCLEEFILNWIDDKPQAHHIEYGLDSQFAEYIVSDNYLDRQQSIATSLQEMKNKAIEAEKQYWNQ